MSCGFAKHLLYKNDKISLHKVNLHTEYSGTLPLYVSSNSSNFGDEIELRTFNQGVHIIIIDAIENNLDHNLLYTLPVLKNSKAKKVSSSRSYFENDILVGIYYYLDFIKEHGFRFPCQYLYVISGVPNLENAYWNGLYLTFGNGKLGSSRAMVCPLIIGHEMTHALTAAGPKLEYYKESGAINESLSDIFGLMFETYLIEHKKHLNIGWEVGNECYFDGSSMRSFKDPNHLGMPASVRDPLFYKGYQDDCGVHINSSVLNHLFYKIQLIIGKKNTFDMFIDLFHKLKYNSKFDDVKRILLSSTNDDTIIELINTIL